MILDWRDPLSFKMHAIMLKIEQRAYQRMREFRKERQDFALVARAKIAKLSDPHHALEFRFPNGRVVTKAWESFTGYLKDPNAWHV